MITSSNFSFNGINHVLPDGVDGNAQVVRGALRFVDVVQHLCNFPKHWHQLTQDHIWPHAIVVRRREVHCDGGSVLLPLQVLKHLVGKADGGAEVYFIWGFWGFSVRVHHRKKLSWIFDVDA